MTLTAPSPRTGDTSAASARLRGDVTVLRVCLLLGCFLYAGLGLVGFVGFAGFWPPPGPDLTAAEIHGYFADHETAIKVGMVLMAMCGPWYYLWGIVVSKVLSEMEGPMGIMANVQRTGAMLTGIVTFTPAVVWMTAVHRIDTVSPENVQMLYDFGWFFFDLTFFCSAIQQVALAVAVLRDPRPVPLMPRWVAWLAVLSSVTFLDLAIMPFFSEGPFAWNGVLSFWAVFVSFFVFVAVVTWYTWTALRRVEAEALDRAAPDPAT